MRDKLIKIFMHKNSQINLSAIRDADGILVKHINDSIELNKILKIKNGKNLCDIGTGGGMPLIPLAMTNPGSNFVGIDARKKKVEAVKEMSKKLGLKNVDCIWSRIEDLEKNYNNQFDYITARAVGHINKIIPWSHKLLKKGGSFILYKQYDESEYQSLLNMCKKYRLYVQKQHKYKLFTGDIERTIYIIKKK